MKKCIFFIGAFILFMNNINSQTKDILTGYRPVIFSYYLPVKSDVYKPEMKTANIIDYDFGGTGKPSLTSYYKSIGKLIVSRVVLTGNYTTKLDDENGLFDYMESRLYEGSAGITIDEIIPHMFISHENRYYNFSNALKKFKLKYPDKLVLVFISGHTITWPSNGITKNMLNTIRDYADLVLAECYLKQSQEISEQNCATFLTHIENISNGILNKTLIVLGTYMETDSKGIVRPNTGTMDKDPHDILNFIEKQIDFYRSNNNGEIKRAINNGIGFYKPCQLYINKPDLHLDEIKNLDKLICKKYFTGDCGIANDEGK